MIDPREPRQAVTVKQTPDGPTALTHVLVADMTADLVAYIADRVEERVRKVLDEYGLRPHADKAL